MRRLKTNLKCGIIFKHLFAAKFDSDLLIAAFDKAVPVHIGQDLSLIPMTEELFDQINCFKISYAIKNFTYLTGNVEEKYWMLLTIGLFHMLKLCITGDREVK